MWRKIRLVLLVVAVVAVGANTGGFGSFLSWVAGLYLLWRAAPGVLRDVRALWAGMSLWSVFRRGRVRPNSTLG